MLISGFDHDNFGVVPAFHVLGLSDPLRGYCLRMMQNFVANFIFIQTIDELLWYLHNPLRGKLPLSRAISTFCAQWLGRRAAPRAFGGHRSAMSLPFGLVYTSLHLEKLPERHRWKDQRVIFARNLK